MAVEAGGAMIRSAAKGAPFENNDEIQGPSPFDYAQGQDDDAKQQQQIPTG
jgi:hypothetical protein